MRIAMRMTMRMTMRIAMRIAMPDSQNTHHTDVKRTISTTKMSRPPTSTTHSVNFNLIDAKRRGSLGSRRRSSQDNK